MNSSEYVIVGGGAFGTGLAWLLATAGASVVVLEKGTIASGSSGGPGARGIRTDHRDLREYPIALRAQEIWPALDERLGHETGYQRIGGLRLIEQEFVGGSGGRASIVAHAWMQNRQGVGTRILEREELLQLEPGIGEAVTHALHVEADGVAPHAKTTVAFAAAARAAGAEVLEHTAALAFERSDARITGVVTPAGTFRASRAVVVTTNGSLGELLGGDTDVVPGWVVVPQAIFVQPHEPHSITHLVNHESRPLSVKPGPEGTVQISGGWRGRWDADHRRVAVEPAIIDAMVREAVAVYPGLAGAEVVGSAVGGPELCAPDGIPVIDRVSGTDNLYYASHWTGHGFAIMPAVIESLRDWLLSGERPEILAPFAGSRFDPAGAAGRVTIERSREDIGRGV